MNCILFAKANLHPKLRQYFKESKFPIRNSFVIKVFPYTFLSVHVRRVTILRLIRNTTGEMFAKVFVSSGFVKTPRTLPTTAKNFIVLIAVCQKLVFFKLLLFVSQVCSSLIMIFCFVLGIKFRHRYFLRFLSIVLSLPLSISLSLPLSAL